MRLALVIVAFIAVPAFAQEAKAPALDALSMRLYRSAAQAAQMADKDCKALPAVQHYNDLRDTLNAHIATTVPGYELDWIKGTLKPKGGK